MEALEEAMNVKLAIALLALTICRKYQHRQGAGSKF